MRAHQPDLDIDLNLAAVAFLLPAGRALCAKLDVIDVLVGWCPCRESGAEVVYPVDADCLCLVDVTFLPPFCPSINLGNPFKIRFDKGL